MTRRLGPLDNYLLGRKLFSVPSHPLVSALTVEAGQVEPLKQWYATKKWNAAEKKILPPNEHGASLSISCLEAIRFKIREISGFTSVHSPVSRKKSLQASNTPLLLELRVARCQMPAISSTSVLPPTFFHF